tara:strand:- start:132 stop:461 length:330 start_codon:yes stop_codon:yes gene_type:complete
MTPQKHSALIHLWADGAEIEVWVTTNAGRDGQWEKANPNWYADREYRVKPKPDVVKKVYIRMRMDTLRLHCVEASDSVANAKLIFCGETGVLKGWSECAGWNKATGETE